MKKVLFVKKILIVLFVWLIGWFVPTAWAITDPLALPNNKFGIHIITPTPDEASPAASLVNSSGGDWGYVTLVIERKDKDQNKWQNFFNDLKVRHLIPIVRIATESVNGIWSRPDPDEASVWADFLDSLEWPIKNRYVSVYNEPNQAKEWGGAVDSADYARELEKLVQALKAKNEDFFVLNAGFDASAPGELPKFEDEVTFLKEMDQAVPGIFEKLDGWVSHSYPNPGFVGLPEDKGRGTVGTYSWELGELQKLGLRKTLPVFITETGWKHAEGLRPNPFLPSADKVSEYYKKAFENIWNDPKIAAVTPFLLTYQEAPFDHFSFKKPPEGSESAQFYPQFQTILDLPKVTGKPVVEKKKRKQSKHEFYNLDSAALLFNPFF